MAVSYILFTPDLRRWLYGKSAHLLKECLCRLPEAVLREGMPGYIIAGKEKDPRSDYCMLGGTTASRVPVLPGACAQNGDAYATRNPRRLQRPDASLRQVPEVRRRGRLPQARILHPLEGERIRLGAKARQAREDRYGSLPQVPLHPRADPPGPRPQIPLHQVLPTPRLRLDSGRPEVDCGPGLLRVRHRDEDPLPDLPLEGGSDGGKSALTCAYGTPIPTCDARVYLAVIRPIPQERTCRR